MERRRTRFNDEESPPRRRRSNFRREPNVDASREVPRRRPTAGSNSAPYSDNEYNQTAESTHRIPPPPAHGEPLYRDPRAGYFSDVGSSHTLDPYASYIPPPPYFLPPVLRQSSVHGSYPPPPPRPSHGAPLTHSGISPYNPSYYDQFHGELPLSHYDLPEEPPDGVQVDFSALQSVHNVVEKTASTLMPSVDAVTIVCANVSRVLYLRTDDLQTRAGASTDEIETMAAELSGFALVLGNLREVLETTSRMISKRAFDNINTLLLFCKKALQKIRDVITTSRKFPSMLNFLKRNSLNSSLSKIKPVRLNLKCLETSLTAIVSTIILAGRQDEQREKHSVPRTGSSSPETLVGDETVDHENIRSRTTYELDAAVERISSKLEDDILANSRAVKRWQQAEIREFNDLCMRGLVAVDAAPISPASQWVSRLVPFDATISSMKRLTRPVPRKTIAYGDEEIIASTSHVDIDEDQEQARITAVVQDLLEKWTEKDRSDSRSKMNGESVRSMPLRSSPVSEVLPQDELVQYAAGPGSLEASPMMASESFEIKRPNGKEAKHVSFEEVDIDAEANLDKTRPSNDDSKPEITELGSIRTRSPTSRTMLQQSQQSQEKNSNLGDENPAVTTSLADEGRDRETNPRELLNELADYISNFIETNKLIAEVTIDATDIVPSNAKTGGVDSMKPFKINAQNTDKGVMYNSTSARGIQKRGPHTSSLHQPDHELGQDDTIDDLPKANWEFDWTREDPMEAASYPSTRIVPYIYPSYLPVGQQIGQPQSSQSFPQDYYPSASTGLARAQAFPAFTNVQGQSSSRTRPYDSERYSTTQQRQPAPPMPSSTDNEVSSRATGFAETLESYSEGASRSYSRRSQSERYRENGPYPHRSSSLSDSDDSSPRPIDDRRVALLREKSLNNVIQQLESDLKGARTIIEQKNQELKNSTDAERMNRLEADLAKSLKDQDEVWAAAERKAAADERNSAAKAEQIAKLEESVAAAEEKATALEASVAAAEEKAAGLESSVTTAEAKVTTLETGVAAANAKVTTLEARLSRRDATIERMKRERDQRNAAPPPAPAPAEPVVEDVVEVVEETPIEEEVVVEEDLSRRRSFSDFSYYTNSNKKPKEDKMWELAWAVIVVLTCGFGISAGLATYLRSDNGMAVGTILALIKDQKGQLRAQT